MVHDLSISLSLSLSLVFVLFCNAYLSPSSYSHILPHIVRVLVVLHNLLICDKCLCLGCNNLLFFPQGSSIMIFFNSRFILNNSYATYQLIFYSSKCILDIFRITFRGEFPVKRYEMRAYKNSFCQLYIALIVPINY